MNKSALLIMGALAMAGASTAQAAFFNSEAAFLPNIQAGYYLEDFSGFTFGTPLNGSQTSWAAPGANGFGWTASATGGLYSNVSALSTNNANNPLIITFTGSPVTAFGGNFTNTDINGNVIPGNVTVVLSNGESQLLINPIASSFLGWTGGVPIAFISITSTGTTNNWPQVDHFYVGSAAVPAPGALALMGLAGLVGKRRRRA